MKDETARTLEDVAQLCLTKKKAVNGVEAAELVHIRSVLQVALEHIEMLVDVWEGNPRPTPILTTPPLRAGWPLKVVVLNGLSVGFASGHKK